MTTAAASGIYRCSDDPDGTRLSFVCQGAQLPECPADQKWELFAHDQEEYAPLHLFIMMGGIGHVIAAHFKPDQGQKFNFRPNSPQGRKEGLYEIVSDNKPVGGILKQATMRLGDLDPALPIYIGIQVEC